MSDTSDVWAGGDNHIVDQPPAQLRSSRNKLIGSGELHRALEAANASARLNAFTRMTGCAPAEVSSDCKSLNVEMVFAAMRARGYNVSAPVKATHQVRGHTTWLVKVGVQGGNVTLAFFTSGEKL